MTSPTHRALAIRARNVVVPDLPAQAAMAMPEAVQSVVKCRENGPLLATAAQLWIGPEDLVLDVTYGYGTFWSDVRPGRLVTHDLALDGVDFRQLPETDASVDVVVFDPPYIPQGGRETSTCGGFLHRYGLFDGPRTVTELDELMAAGMKEATRVLRPGGRLMVKCMDYVSGGAYVQGRHKVVAGAAGLGLRQVDEFVHYSGLGPTTPGHPIPLPPGPLVSVCLPSSEAARRHHGRSR